MEAQFTFRIGDIVTIIIYFAGLILLGVWTTRKIKQTEDYFVGGRAMPGWAVGMSMLGTAISSITFLAYPGSAFEGNWSRLVQGLMLPMAALTGVVFFVVYYRRSLFLSAYQYFEKRFGGWGRSYASIIYILGQIFRMGTVLFLLATAIKVMTHWHILTIMIIVGILVTLYTVLGGLEAVIWTDVIQTIFLILGGVVTILVVFFKVKGGMFEVINVAANAGKFDLTTSWEFDLTRDTFWIFALSGIIGNIQEFSSDQIKIQRYAAPSTDGGAKRAVWTVGLGCIPVWSIFMFVGTCLWVFYQIYPQYLAAGLRPDQIFPHFILTQLPVGFGGFVIAAVMAAAMSTIDSSLNASATVISVDWYKRFFVKDRDDTHYLKMARIITLTLGVLMILAAWLLTKLNMKTFLDIGFFLGAVFAGGIGGFFLLGFFFKRANGQGAIVGVVVGVFVILWLTLSHLSHFVITDQSLTDLKSAGVSVELIEKLDDLEGKRFKEKDLVAALKTIIGEKQTAEYQELILKKAKHYDLLPQRLVSSTHPFIINVFGNLTVLLVGLLASLFWPAPTEAQLKRATWWTRNA